MSAIESGSVMCKEGGWKKLCVFVCVHAFVVKIVMNCCTSFFPHSYGTCFLLFSVAHAPLCLVLLKEAHHFKGGTYNGHWVMPRGQWPMTTSGQMGKAK